MLYELRLIESWEKIIYHVTSRHVIKLRLRDQYTQNMFASLSKLSCLTIYCQYKLDYCFEKNIDNIFILKFLRMLFNLRWGVLNINIEIGRFQNNPWEERFRPICNMNTKENKYNFWLVCPCYGDCRTKYLKKYHCTWHWVNKHQFVNCKIWMWNTTVS